MSSVRPTTHMSLATCIPFADDNFSIFRATHQIVFLHCAKIHSGLGAKGNYAFFGEFREGQPSIRIGNAFV